MARKKKLKPRAPYKKPLSALSLRKTYCRVMINMTPEDYDKLQKRAYRNSRSIAAEGCVAISIGLNRSRLTALEEEQELVKEAADAAREAGYVSDEPVVATTIVVQPVTSTDTPPADVLGPPTAPIPEPAPTPPPVPVAPAFAPEPTPPPTARPLVPIYY